MIDEHSLNLSGRLRQNLQQRVRGSPPTAYAAGMTTSLVDDSLYIDGCSKCFTNAMNSVDYQNGLQRQIERKIKKQLKGRMEFVIQSGATNYKTNYKQRFFRILQF